MSTQPVRGSQRDAELASTLLDLRSPLSRIELAASRLVREDMPPRARDLATIVRDSVAAIDSRLTLALRSLERPAVALPMEAAPVLEAVLQRIGPVLAARGFPLELDPVPALQVDSRVLRRAVIALVRLAAERGQPGPPIRLTLRPDPVRPGLQVSYRPLGRDAGTQRAARDAAAGLAVAAGGWLEESASGATLWWTLEGGTS